MSEQETPRRRRRPAQPLPEQQEPAASEQPHRIVASGEEEPAWMVSAHRVSGAASRRTKGAAPEQGGVSPAPAPRADDRRAQENRAILAMRNQGNPRAAGRQERETPAAPMAPNPLNAPNAPAAPNTSAAPNAPAAPKASPARAAKAPAMPRMQAQEGSIPVAERGAAARKAAAKSAKPAPSAKAAKTVKSAAKAAPKPKAERPPKKPLSKKARARRNAQIRRAALGVLCAALFIALGVAGVLGGGRLIDIKKTLDHGDGVFYPNIFVNGIPLAGMTLDQAADLVTRQVQNQISAWRITLRATDGSGRTWDITGDDLKMKYDVADQLDQLWAIGHTGSSSARYEQVKKLETEPAIRYTTLSYDLSRVNQILTTIKAEVDRPPVSATRINDETKWPPYSYTDDTPGQELDISGLNEKICAMVDTLQSGTVDLAPTPVQAPITREQLEGSIVLLSEYETAIGATSDPGRFINIEVGTGKFDKLIIKSGESVSFNKVAGKRTYSNGYADAPEVAYGDYTMGVGGGICQVSSTLYNAVVNAGLTVTKRTQHSLPSNYVPYGLDATVADDRLDFVFKNSTNADIYISTEYYKKKGYWHCKFTIHGRPDPNGYTYKLESEIKEEIPVPEPTYIPDKDAQYVVYDDETYQASKGEEGYVVDVYLLTMDQNGMELSREYKYTDTYKTKAPKIYVGVTPRETPAPPMLGID